jgi:dynein assembly factor 3, axonemal
MASQLYPSIGFHGFYGLSAAFDFTEAIEASIKTVAVVDEPLRILLVGPGDVRHIIATVSRRRRHRAKDIMKCKENKRMRPIHFYFIETPIEVVARNVLLLELVNDYEVPIRQRASIFLEIFGNCRVQDRTAKYIEQLGQQLRSLVTTGAGRLEGLIDLSLLRYRARDDLENAFKSYSKATSFDVDSLRDHRLRGKFFKLNPGAEK